MIMKIALITTSFLPAIGGAEFVVHHLAQQWSLQGHNVCVFNSLTDEIYHPDANYSVKKYRLIRGGKRFGFHRRGDHCRFHHGLMPLHVADRSGRRAS